LEFDERNFTSVSNAAVDDPTLRRISYILWTIHDDFIDHPICVSAECWESLSRIVIFLGTDLELVPVPRRAPVPRFWPFATESDWRAYEHLLPAWDLPPYDPAAHSRRYQPWWNRIPSGVGIALLVGLIIVALAVCAFL
jgi:hypothetical protein